MKEKYVEVSFVRCLLAETIPSKASSRIRINKFKFKGRIYFD